MYPCKLPLLEQLFIRFPGLAQWRQEVKGTVLEAVQRALRPPVPPRRISSRLRMRMSVPVRKLLGRETAMRLDRHLRASPHVLIAHHHGIICHPEFIQSALVFALPQLVRNESSGVVPVLACSTVALRSFSFPRGLLLARHSSKETLVRLPLFPSSSGDLMVRTVPPLDMKQAHRALGQWKQLGLTRQELRVASALVEEHVLAPDVLELPSYSDQVTRINASIWRGLCGEKAPELAFLDMEDITTELLMEALRDKGSLFHELLFHGPVRQELYAALAGVPGCWPAGEDGEAGGGRGTAFFWLVHKGQRRPLRLQQARDPFLTYGDTVVPFTRDAILEGLEKKWLIPGLYCSCILLGQHGLLPHGGIYMREYLPRMQRATAAVIRKLDLLPLDGEFWPEPVLGTGFMPLRMRMNKAWACGLIELMAGKNELDRALRHVCCLPADRACLFSFADWWLESTNAACRPEDWPELLSRLLSEAEGCSFP